MQNSWHVERMFIVKDVKGTSYFPLASIVRFEADDNYTIVHMKNKQQHIICGCLSEHFKRVRKTRLFCRIHKSHVVHVEYVERVNKIGTVVMLDGTVLPLTHSMHDTLIRMIPAC